MWFNLPPAAIFADPNIGGQVLTLAGTVMSTVSICGWFIVFVLKSGIVGSSAPCWSPSCVPSSRCPAPPRSTPCPPMWSALP
ncbi:MAG: hypothetical protein V8Q30_07565 [Acutalibacteraceae bacterium]